MKILCTIARMKIVGWTVIHSASLRNVIMDGSFLLIGLRDLFTQSLILIEAHQVEVIPLIFKMMVIIFLETRLF